MCKNKNLNLENSDERRIRIADARKMLGMIGRNYSDAEMSEILHCLYTIAELAYDDTPEED